MNIFLRYEILVRELDANILTGLIAASRGHRAIVCDWPTMMRGIFLRRRQRGFVHMKSLTPGKSTLIFHRIFKFFGFRISSLDQEAGISHISYETFANARYSDATVSAADLIYCWGPDDYDTLRLLYPGHTSKIIMSGSPRVDLWRPKFSSLYVSARQSAAPSILILSSLGGPLSYRRLSEDLIRHRSAGYFDRDPKMEAQLVGQYKEGADLMLEYRDLILSLSLNHKGLPVIVKPHPSEDPVIWRKILAGIDGVRVDAETSTSQLIRESSAVITTGSTTAFEAEVSETPLISFQPIDAPHRNAGFADRLGIRASTVEEVHVILSGILNLGHEKALTLKQKTSRLELSKKIYFKDDHLAADRMVDAWERAIESDSERAAGGSIFSMPSEDFRYFIASAFPFLIPLFVWKRRTGLALGSRTNRKRPPLKRKLVGARLEEMRSILGLQDSVSYRFKGRRGVVIEPSPSARNRGIAEA